MYKIVLHKEVLSKDLKELGPYETEKIFKVIKEKLEIDPIHFGKPLRKELKGYYRLRVDFYRVIYEIKNQEVTVFVLKVGKRKDNEVYKAALKRL
jgi:mRNA interferase RelE/StbE